MINGPHKVQHTTIRLDPDLKKAAQAKAAAADETLSDVIRRALERYVRDEEGQ